MRIAAAAPFRRTELFGGTFSVDVWDVLGRTPAAPFTAVLWCELEPGGSVGRHRQEQHPEIIVGIDGRGVATVDDTERPIERGTMVHLPLGSVLAIRNDDTEAPLTYLIIKAKA